MSESKLNNDANTIIDYIATINTNDMEDEAAFLDIVFQIALQKLSDAAMLEVLSEVRRRLDNEDDTLTCTINDVAAVKSNLDGFLSTAAEQ